MITEDQLEQQCLRWFEDTGWNVAFGPDIAHDGGTPERESYREVVLVGRLARALASLNPQIPPPILDEALLRLLKLDHPVAEQRNRDFHRLLLNGLAVSWRQGDDVKHDHARLVDFTKPDANEFLVVNQFAIRGPQKTRRPDIVVFVNGLPLSIIELKNPTDENADVWKAYHQLQTYKEEVPDIFNYNEALIVSDGFTARVGSLTADQGRFLPWRTVKNEDDRPVVEYEIEKIIRGFFDRALFLDYLKHFILFEQDGDRLVKKIAGYHQFHAVREAVRVTVIAAQAAASDSVEEPRASYGTEVVPGSRKAGVVWHTQGSGKSISMVCYAGKLIQQAEMKNPTIVVVTDRNDLDGQLYETFCQAQELLKQTPEQADSREELRLKLASRQAGGIIFTTVQKFSLDEGENEKHPVLCERSNVVVISDEAHRSQYGLKARLVNVRDKDTKLITGKKYVYGFAKYMRDALPEASFIGFTGTPIDKGDHDTRAVFGDYVSVYDIQDAVKDGATVEIFYESRLAKLDVNRAEIEKLCAEVEEVVEDEEDMALRERTKGIWSTLEKLVGAKERTEEIAADLIKHFEARNAVITGKAMIVGMSREICARLYAAIIELRPEWHSDDIEKGVIKVVMTGTASDIAAVRPHATTKRQKKRLEKRFKNPADPLRLVIVRDMWLTGFDAPCCHTMYVDKPMKGHNLMQAIARVNRVFKDKPGGLVVDYIGIANDLKLALKVYAESKGRGDPCQSNKTGEKALPKLLSSLDACRGLFHGFDYSAYRIDPMVLLVPAANHILDVQKLPDRKKRFLDLVAEITSAYALCGTLDEVAELKTEIAFFSAVKAAIVKYTTVDRKRTEAEKNTTLRRILDNAIISEGVADIFALAGLKKPNIGLLSPDFLQDIRNMPQKNLAVELLEKLLRDEIKAHTRTNVVLQKKFGDRLMEALRKYHNRAIETAQVIEELLKMAGDFKEALGRNDELGLGSDEIAFYDALAERPEVLRTMGDVTLKQLATELTEQLRNSTSVDWQVRESVRAKMRILIKRLLRKYKYPPDGQDEAVARVIEQAEALADVWSK
ncbi:MAG: type I restriction endonuclease subunit R [Opitutus sp.]|nr:type I restriction endonuclease subunit R [Opitutus sp.]MCS6246041.1 type I restriction endonuclease subunit R [Opitutus sp.]MCS6273924.1 type I restriction endonuclease subunit R [Opitutus sp.]MCS6276232.1 type I restriction endonuclease subunit R [Opitutus sp.]MCS6301326.1 type I restriction endonuclease subunit R [Opitutus sp.]